MHNLLPDPEGPTTAPYFTLPAFGTETDVLNLAANNGATDASPPLFALPATGNGVAMSEQIEVGGQAGMAVVDPALQNGEGVMGSFGRGCEWEEEPEEYHYGVRSFQDMMAAESWQDGFGSGS